MKEVEKKISTVKYKYGLGELLFRVAIGYDKSIGDYRTMEVNVVADVIRAIIRTCRDEDTKSDCDFHLQSLDVEKT